MRPDASGAAADPNRPAGRERTASEEGPVVYRLSADAGKDGPRRPQSAGRRRPERARTASISRDARIRFTCPGGPRPSFSSSASGMRRTASPSTYHRKVKEKEDLRSLLDRIPGIGPARRKALLVFFGDVKRIRAASVEELRQVAGIGGETARRIREFLDGGSPAAAGTARRSGPNGTEGGIAMTGIVPLSTISSPRPSARWASSGAPSGRSLQRILLPRKGRSMDESDPGGLSRRSSGKGRRGMPSACSCGPFSRERSGRFFHRRSGFGRVSADLPGAS